MDEAAHPRVVVGVDASVHGLAALRAASAEARRRRVPLYAIRSRNSVQVAEDLDLIKSAFLEAFGEIPTDLDIHATVCLAGVRDALTDCARDPRDLIVVGTSGKGAWHALWSGSVARSLIRRARCPILAVPAPEMARAVHGRKLARASRDDLWEQFEQSDPEPRGKRHIDG